MADHQKTASITPKDSFCNNSINVGGPCHPSLLTSPILWFRLHKKLRVPKLLGMEDEYVTPSNTVDRMVSWTRRPKPPSQGENHPAMRRPQNLFFINPRRSIGHQRLSNRSSYLDLASQFSPTSTIGQRILSDLKFHISMNFLSINLY